MKKIEELAAEKYLSEQNLPERKRTPSENYIDWAEFGAREAQRWIHINEDFPTGEIIWKGEYQHDKGFLDLNELSKSEILQVVRDNGLIYWRPIERH